MRYPPPEVRASWPKPNYVDPERRGPALMIVEITLLVIVTIFVAIRLYARLAITRARLGLDDIAIIISWMFAVGLTAGVILAIKNYGWDLHIWDLPPADNVTSRKVSWACMILYLVSCGFAKISILLFYLRILVTKLDRLITKITLAVTIPLFITIILIVIFQCLPFGYYWEILVPGSQGHCLNEGQQMISFAAVNIVFDVIILLIPLRSLLRLKIRFAQKLQVILLFSAGVLVVIAAAVRTYFIVVISNQTYDVTWYGYTGWLWAAVEVHVSIICACVPSCRAFFVSWNRSQNGTNQSGTYPAGTARSYNYIDEDARALTRNAHVGNHANVTTGSLKSETSTEFMGDDRKGGVRVQMEVMQYQEEYVAGSDPRTNAVVVSAA